MATDQGVRRISHLCCTQPDSTGQLFLRSHTPHKNEITLSNTQNDKQK